MTNDRRVDEWGRTVLNPKNVFDLAYEGLDIWALPVDSNTLIEQFKETCRMFDNGVSIETIKPLDITPEEEHTRRAQNWFISEEIRLIPVRSFLLSLCANDVERERVNMEMDLFEERDLIPLLQLMMYLIDHFRQKEIVWGVGRGSSVASYCLFLLGVHRINSIQYNLDIGEFLK
jgi:DNA polymerase III alpha subunit